MKTPKGFIKINRNGAPAYVRPWVKQLSERSYYEFTRGREATEKLCKKQSQMRFLETIYIPLD
jgi:hypothetical protein